MPEGQTRTPETPSYAPPEIGSTSVETSFEHQPAPVEKPTIAETPPAPVAPIMPVTPTIAPKTGDAISQERVESILVDGLLETYKKLDPATQQKFKVSGERTASSIAAMLQSTKVNVKKILELIITWLRIIPGVNRLFLEQEAKIKADQLLNLRQPPKV